MHSRPFLKSSALVSAILLALVSTGCGSGGGGTSNGSGGGPASTTISGTAARGNPITGGTCAGSLNGVVTLRDSATPAHTATVATDCNGNYSFSLNSSYLAPFMVSVSYTVAGTTYQLTSAGSATSINSSGQGTINITPLTDLVIANVGHDLASNIFSNANYASLLTPAALAAGQAALDQQLAPLLTQLGLSATVDLLNSSFQANGTGVDALLNVLNVNVDPVTKLATITNALNNATVVDNLAATTPNTTPISTAGTTSATASDLQGIATALQSLATQLASAPSSSSPGLVALFDATHFLLDGMNLSAFLQGLLSNSQAPAAISDSSISLNAVPAYASAAVPGSATASYDVVVSAGVDFIYYKSSGGQWINLGNQRIASAEVHADSAEQFPGAAGNASAVFCSGLEVDVKDNGGIPSGQALSYAIVTGPGLPAGGALLFKSATNGPGLQWAAGGPSTYAGTATPPFVGNGQGGACNSGTAYWMTDADIATLNPAGTYSISLYYDNGTPTVLGDDVVLATYSTGLPVPPLASTQLAGAFATNGVATPSLASVAAAGGTSTITWTAPTNAGMRINELDISLPTASGSNSVSVKSFSSPTATSATVTVPQTAIPNGYQAGISIWYDDNQHRSFISQF